MRSILLLAFAFWFSCSLISQSVEGIVVDADQEPLSFASVYVTGTSTGTSTNLQGKFSLSLLPGSYELSVRYVGYKTENVTIEVKQDSEISLSIVLLPVSFEFSEVVIRADGEDPAYRIIRNAIARRSHYLNHIEKLSCRTYIKGTYYLEERPSSFFGIDIEEDHIFISRDSVENPIVYLAETETQYFKMAPNLRREIVKSTRVSGDSRGFAFNSALLMDVNLYESEVSLMTSLKSPIGRGAFGYYDYRMDGVTVGSDGKLINKIEVIPKNSRGPVFAGFIYIRDDSWNIIEADLFITGKNIQNNLLDTMRIKQVHIPLDDDKWVLFQQNLDIRVSFMGFVISGGFNGLFSDYDLDPDIDKLFFRSEIIGFDSEYNQREANYWDSIRPIPLIEQEEWDFLVKDSIEAVRNDPLYIDSLDREYNKFKWTDILLGYQYRKKNRDYSGAIYSPIRELQFNAVKGFHTNFRGEFLRGNIRRVNDELKAELLINYGFSSRSVQPQLRFHFLTDPIFRTSFTLSLGRKNSQFHEGQDMPELVNSLHSLISARNYARYFEKDYLKLQSSSRPLRWLSYSVSLEYAVRSEVENNTNFSFKNDADPFLPNIPLPTTEFEFETHSLIKSSIRINFFPGAKFVSFPDSRLYLGNSRLPSFTLGFDAGNYFDGKSGFFLKLLGGVVYNRSLGTWGLSSLRLVSGITPIGKERLDFIDQRHFFANEASVLLSGDLNRSFFKLPHYQYSTSGAFLEFHYEHDFGGKFIGNIPGIRSLGMHWQSGFKFLKVNGKRSWNELFIGLNNIGIGPLKIFRLDGVFVLEESSYKGSYLRVSARLPVSRNWYY